MIKISLLVDIINNLAKPWGSSTSYQLAEPLKDGLYWLNAEIDSQGRLHYEQAVELIEKSKKSKPKLDIWKLINDPAVSLADFAKSS